MAYIRTISPKNATGSLANSYQDFIQLCGYDRIPKVIQILSLRPDTMKRIIRVWELGMWVSDEPRDMLELVAALVSRMNQCHY